MGNVFALRQFRVFRIDKPNWFDAFFELLKKEYFFPPMTRLNAKFIALLYQAHLLGVRCIVIHDGYICQDYQGDYATLYSRMARPPEHRAIRLLFFNSDKSDNDIFVGLKGGMPIENAWEDYEHAIGLIGFAVIRPTPDCHIGRTVISPRRPHDGFITCEESYLAHLYGTPLYVRGVPWLEQDVSSFVCGGAALWACAFHTQTRWGLPHYSPGELTAQARRFSVSGHISKGMTSVEIATAIREWGFEPYSRLFSEGDDPSQREDLYASLHMLLESKISTVLGFWLPDHGGHAALAVGHGLQKEPRKGIEGDEFRPTTAWLDRFVTVDDQRFAYTPRSICDGRNPDLSFVFFEEAIRWAEKSAQLKPPPSSAPLDKAKRIFIVAPFPRGVRVLPDDVLPIAQQTIRIAPKIITREAIEDDKKAEELRAPFTELLKEGTSHYLRPYLTQLKDFHWDLKINPSWVQLADDIRLEYLQITWPSWLWVVQIVQVPQTTDGKDPWSEAKAVGEVLIDATASPRVPLGAAFAIRVRGVLLYFPSLPVTVVRSVYNNVTYPVICL